MIIFMHMYIGLRVDERSSFSLISPLPPLISSSLVDALDATIERERERDRNIIEDYRIKINRY